MTPAFKILVDIDGSPLSLLLSRLHSPGSLSLSSQGRCSSPLTIFIAPRWALSSSSLSPLNWGAQNWTWAAGVSSPGQAEMEDHLSRAAGHAAPNVPQDDPIALLGHRDTQLARGQLAVPQNPQALLRRAAFQQVTPGLCWCMGLSLPRCRTLHLPLLSFIRFLSSQLSSLPRCH